MQQVGKSAEQSMTRPIKVKLDSSETGDICISPVPHQGANMPWNFQALCFNVNMDEIIIMDPSQTIIQQRK